MPIEDLQAIAEQRLPDYQGMDTGAYQNDMYPFDDTGARLQSSGEGSTQPRLPFEIYVSDGDLVGAPGTLDGDSIAEVTEASPANGTWYLEAKVTINETTGAVTATATQWSSAESADTATIFYYTIASIIVTSGDPDPDSIVQNNYGPMLVIMHGTTDGEWAAYII